MAEPSTLSQQAEALLTRYLERKATSSRERAQALLKLLTNDTSSAPPGVLSVAGLKPEASSSKA